MADDRKPLMHNGQAAYGSVAPPAYGQPAGHGPASPPQGQYPPGQYPPGQYAPGQQGPATPSAPPVPAAVPADHDVCAPPPDYFEATGIGRPQFQLPRIHDLPNDQLQDVLLDRMQSNCCAGTTAAKEMHIVEKTNSNVLYYRFYSYTERRLTRRATEAYCGQMIDGPENGPPPSPWSIPAMVTVSFVEAQQLIPVPHTSVVQTCEKCNGAGQNCCHRCCGAGWNACSFCRGDGRANQGGQWVTCSSCAGNGRSRCSSCCGSGHIRCNHCEGSGRIVAYIQLVINWFNHESDNVFAEDALGLPVQYIKKGEATRLLTEEGARVAPITGSPVPKLDAISQHISAYHEGAWGGERILVQKHVLESVPVTHVIATWKDKQFSYWVYGLDGQAHAPEYPQAGCCWCCNIM